MTPPQPSQQTPKDAEKAEPLTVSSDTLLAGRRELIIEHDNQRYRLLLTRSNKLILTK
jgi:hemin uptake protein HemP